MILAVAAALLALASPAASAETGAEYRDLIARYARGDRASAIAVLARFSDS